MDREAILLIGPTASGKTPLGELLETSGLWGRRCRHFDFGERLRAAGSGEADGFDEATVALVRSILDEGRLLSDEELPLAAAILSLFARELSGEDLVVLNGLPRHAGQLEAVEAEVAIATVVELVCPAEVVIGRIASDAGGDRSSRVDDGTELVRKKLALYEERTRPLVGMLEDRGARVCAVDVAVDTMPQDILARLEEMGGR